MITADKTVPAARKNLHHRTRATTAPPASREPDGDPITIQHSAHIRHREIDVIGAIVGDQKAEAIPVGSDCSGNNIELLAEAILTAAIDQQLTRGAQCLKTAP